ncbi:MAG: hypothetical protein Q7R51_01495 [bacterium]|nr:hypothetical protein [bacterium]
MSKEILDQRPWTDQRFDKLGRLGWKFSNKGLGKINPTLAALVAANDTKTPELLDSWKVSGDPIEISIVIVPPNGQLADLPARALAYAASALNFSSSLREGGVCVDRLRIMSPSHANIYANGGNLDAQLENAGKVQKLIQSYQENYLPELDGLKVTLDTGKPITLDVEVELEPNVTYLQKNHSDIARDLYGVSLRYEKNGDQEHLLDERQRPLVYLLSHPPAWGYSEETVIYDRNGDRRINFMPASELRYLEYMKRIEGKGWTPSTDKQIATVISNRQTFAPYNAVRIGSLGNEPSIGDLAQETSALQLSLDQLTRYHPKEKEKNVVENVAEVVVNLDQLKRDTEQAVRKRMKFGFGKPRPLDQVIAKNI